MKRKLNKNKVTGKRSIFYFKKPDGEIVRDVRTAEYFNSLAEKDAPVPVHPSGFEYLYGELCPQYEGPEGDLPDDSYAVLPSGYVAIRLREYKKEGVFKRDEIDENDEVVIE